MSDDRIIQRINASGADFLVVALGARKGQAWIERNRARLAVPVISHLGAVLNFVAGTVKRAPSWMQRIGLEWLWRVKEEPALWVRYFRDGLALLGLFTTRVLPHAWFLRRHRPDRRSLSSARVETREDRDAHVLVLSGHWTRENLARLRDCFAKAALSQKDVHLNLHATTHVDCWFVGLAVLLQGHQSLHGKALHVVGAQVPVRRVIRYCCAEYLLACPPARPSAASDRTLGQPAMVSGAHLR
jgi:N-acetylglucosaminyldiphosphoundecaprenol N-acetyl-beta-D-mannosaminyltransferase